MPALRLARLDAPTPAYRAVVGPALPLLDLLSADDFSGQEHVPPTGPVIFCANHTSNLDFLAVGRFLISCDRAPRWLAKDSLFAGPLGPFMRAVDHIPVHRNTASATSSLASAEQALAQGRSVVVMPEGTFTTDPHLWPMSGKTGAARLALRTHAPVVPLAQWGVERTWPPRRWPRPARLRMAVRAGATVALDDLYDVPLTREVLVTATDRILDAITAELEVLRGEQAPDVRHDPGSYRGPNMPRSAG